jgi:hypothetical protein
MERILLNAGPSERGSHRLEDVAVCPQRYAYRHVLGLAPDGDADPLVRGCVAHSGFAQHYARLRARQRGEDPERYGTPEEGMEREAARWGEAGQNLLAATALTVAETVAHYADDFEVLAVEEEVRARVTHGGRGPHLFTARWDVEFRDAAGRCWVMDHKVVTQLNVKKVSARYTNALQFLAAQYLGALKYGRAFGGVVLSISQQAPRTRFLRAPLDPSPGLLRQLPQIVCDDEERIAELANRDPWEYPKAASEQVCMSAYGRCGYFERCRWGKAV